MAVAEESSMHPRLVVAKVSDKLSVALIVMFSVSTHQDVPKWIP